MFASVFSWPTEARRESRPALRSTRGRGGPDASPSVLGRTSASARPRCDRPRPPGPRPRTPERVDPVRARSFEARRWPPPGRPPRAVVLELARRDQFVDGFRSAAFAGLELSPSGSRSSRRPPARTAFASTGPARVDGFEAFAHVVERLPPMEPHTIELVVATSASFAKDDVRVQRTVAVGLTIAIDERDGAVASAAAARRASCTFRSRCARGDRSGGAGRVPGPRTPARWSPPPGDRGPPPPGSDGYRTRTHRTRAPAADPSHSSTHATNVGKLGASCARRERELAHLLIRATAQHRDPGARRLPGAPSHRDHGLVEALPPRLARRVRAYLGGRHHCGILRNPRASLMAYQKRLPARSPRAVVVDACPSV